MTAYANAATLEYVPRWAVDDAKDLYEQKILKERENAPEEPYRCGICGQKLKTLEKLEKHIKGLHERENRKKVAHVWSIKGGKKRQKLQRRYEPYMSKYRETSGGLVPKVDYDVDEELTRAMVTVVRVGSKAEAADSALKGAATMLCFPRKDGTLLKERTIDCLVLVSDDAGFKKMLKKVKAAGIKTVQVGSKCALRKAADDHVAWYTLVEEARKRHGELSSDASVENQNGE